MDLTYIIEQLKAHPGLSNHIGIELVSTPEEGVCEARMPIDQRNSQPWGYASGGALLALGETLAGAGSCALRPGHACVGMNVSAQHVHSAPVGTTVCAKARLLHFGGQTHVWQVEVRDEQGELISNISVTNFVL